MKKERKKEIKTGDTYRSLKTNGPFHTKGKFYMVLEAIPDDYGEIRMTCNVLEYEYRITPSLLKDDYVKVMNTTFLIRELFNSIAVYEN